MPVERTLASRVVTNACSVASTPFAGGEWWLYGVPWACLLLGALWGWLSPASAQSGGVPFLLVSSLAFGMPHGAGDWLLLHGRHTHALSAGTRNLLLALYVPLAAAVIGLWWLNPTWALLLFLALTTWHWGSADAWQLFSAGKAPSFFAWALFAVGRGLLLMCAPLALRPSQSGLFLAGFVNHSDGPFIADLLRKAPSLLVCALLLQVVAWLLGGKNSLSRVLWSAVETGLLLILFAVTPPLLAIGIYFVGVHSWRHIGRLFFQDDASSSPAEAGKKVWQFHYRVWPISALALVGCVPILLLWPSFQRGAVNWSVAYLILISALTLPHALVVGALDYWVWKNFSSNLKQEVKSYTVLKPEQDQN